MRQVCNIYIFPFLNVSQTKPPTPAHSKKETRNYFAQNLQFKNNNNKEPFAIKTKLNFQEKYK